MKNLKIKLVFFSLLATLAISVFLTSCEQETIATIQTSDEIQEMMSKIIQDVDVDAFIYATFKFNNAIRNDRNSEQIKIVNISDLHEHMLKTAFIVLTKFPEIDEIDEESIEKFYLNNPQFEETVSSNYQSTELESRSCSNWWEELKKWWCIKNCSKAHLETFPIPPDWDAYNNCTDNCDC